MSRHTLVLASLVLGMPLVARADVSDPIHVAIQTSTNMTLDQQARAAAPYNYWAMQETQRQIDQFAEQRRYFDRTVHETITNDREDTNHDRPIRGARMIAGGPPKIMRVQKPIRLEPIKYKYKRSGVGGIASHMGASNGGSGSHGNFGRIFSGGNGSSLNFHGLSEGAHPFNLGLH